MSPEEPSRILVVDDDQPMRDLLVQGLTSETTTVEAVAGGQAALARLLPGDIDLVITDLRMPGLGGLELCSRIVELSSGLPVIVMTAFGDYEAAVSAMRAGAYDFMAKPVRMDVLRLAVERAVNHSRLRREVRKLKSSLQAKQAPGIIGESRVMRDLMELLARVAASSSSVLVTGESGTGKELIAKALHDQSGASGRFVAVNCAAIPEQLLESELFGHERGAFTDAKASRAGLFAEANGGTLFLDEIGEMPMGLQPKLLRALQERTIRPIGGRRDIPFDARLVCATNRDLALAVEEGRFRQDLYFVWNALVDSLLYAVFIHILWALRQRLQQEMAARQDALGQLRHAERLTTLGRLASGIAHEIGTPLNVITGRAELIASGSLKSDAIAASANIVVAQADRISVIIRQLLDFARKGGTRVERTDLSSLVEHTALLLGPLAGKSGVEIVSTGDHAEADVNRSELQQVITNLITNGIHAMPGGGKLDVSVSTETARDPRRTQATPEVYAVVRVQDHGLGISAETLPRIFEPFFTTRDVGVGTGLGLSVAFGIVQDHGGWIAVDTTPGEGTTVSVYLPKRHH